MSGDLDRAKILAAFEMLSRHLRHRGIRAHIYIVRGAAMVLTHRRSRTTVDIDTLIVDATGSVIQAAREIAAKLGLPRNWLNDDIRTLSIMPPPRDTRAAIVFDSPNLVVTGASATHLLAMKAHASRANDMDDIRALCTLLGVSTVEEIREIHDRVFPRHPIPLDAESRLGSLDLTLESTSSD